MKSKLTLLTLCLVFITVFCLSVAVAAAEESQSALRAQATISQEEAGKTALAKVTDGKIKSAEIEKEHGKLIWSFDISIPKSSKNIEIQVDAKTGKIVSDTETPKEQAKEAKEAADDKKREKTVIYSEPPEIMSPAALSSMRKRGR